MVRKSGEESERKVISDGWLLTANLYCLCAFVAASGLGVYIHIYIYRQRIEAVWCGCPARLECVE